MPVPPEVPKPPKTLFRNARWAVLWSDQEQAHYYAENVDVVMDDGRIAFAGAEYPEPIGPNDVVIDASDRLLAPGLINLHCHPHTEPAYKGLREDHGRPEQYGTGLYERLASFSLSEEGRRAGAELSYGEMLQGGITCLMDLSTPFDDWIDLAAQSGLRVFLAPGFASSKWYMDNLHEVKYDWNEAGGQQALQRAIEVMDRADAHPSGRLSGVVFPAQIDTCTESLLRDAIALAEETKRPLTTHIAQSMMEFLEMVRRNGITPIQWAHSIGLLGPRTVAAHSIFLDSHPDTQWRTARDLALLSDTGTSVAHCPSPFARYGVTMDDFGAYCRAGVNVGIGTDVAPHNVWEEMRLAIILARVASRDINTTDAGLAFHAATVGAANALGRPDLGRIAPGAQADVVLVDLKHPSMCPVRDPIRTLIFEAAERAITDVFVAGEHCLKAGKVTSLDMPSAAAALQKAQQEMISATPQRDFLSRKAEEIAPMSLAVRDL